MFCSLGCGLLIRTEGGRPVGTDYDIENPVNRGSLCPRGQYVLELLNSPERIPNPMVRLNRLVLGADPAEALKILSLRLKAVVNKHGPDSVGIVIGSERLNEEIYLTHRISKKLGFKNIAVAFSSEDYLSLHGEHIRTSFREHAETPSELSDPDSFLIIGDILTRSPVISQKINAVKYKNRDNKIIVIDPVRSRTSWFATSHLKLVPGTESLLLAGMIKALIDSGGRRAVKLKRYFKDIDLKDISDKTGIPEKRIVQAAADFSSAKMGAIIVSSGFRDALLVEMTKLLAFCAGRNFGVIPFYSSPNAIGAYRIASSLRPKDAVSFPQMMSMAVRGSIKAMVLLGVDPGRAVSDAKAAKAFSKLELLAISDIYRIRAMDYADIILPLASQNETNGSIIYSGERAQEISSVAPPAQSMTIYDILRGICSGFEKDCILPPHDETAAETKKALREYEPAKKFKFSRLLDSLNDMKPLKQSKDYPFLVHLADDISHVGDGSITVNHFWACRECPSPYIEMNERDAAQLKICDGDRVLVKTPKTQTVINARIASGMASGVVAMPHHFGEVRELVDMEHGEGTEVFLPTQMKVAIEKIG
jgi:predicted molibdopterin-dependent oxidoreductase YjgC